MSSRLKFALPLMGFFVILAWKPLESVAQEPLPSLDGPFLVPDSSRNPSPLERGSSPDSEASEVPSLDLPAGNVNLLNNLFSHQWVRTNADQRLSGTVMTLVGQDTLSVSSIRVTLAQQGRVVATVISDAEGGFVFDRVLPGFYSIVANADNSFAALGLTVLSEESGSHLPNAIELRVIRPKSDEVRRILNADLIPTQLSATGDRDVRDPISAKRVFAKSHQIMATKDGRVVGHLSQVGVPYGLVDMSEMKAMLLKDGREIARSDVSKEGAFEFENVVPGCYGFAAVGNRGVAAVAFCVVEPDSLTHRKSLDGKLFVMTSLQMAAAELNVELADSADVMSVEETGSTEGEEEVAAEEVAEEEIPLAQPMMPFGGSNMFGAGQVINGGSSNMIGDLVGLGALGVMAWVIADSYNDDNTVNAAIVSPIVQ